MKKEFNLGFDIMWMVTVKPNSIVSKEEIKSLYLQTRKRER